MSSIENLTFKQKALSLNHQNEGEKKIPYLSIAYTAEDAAGALTEEIIDGYFGKYTYRSWFNINGSVATPMDWTKRFDLKCSEGFQDVPVTMKLKTGAKKELELEFDGCRLYFDSLRLIGGMILPDFHIHVIDHTEQQMIQIRRAEFTEVRLSLGEGVLIERKQRKQRDLPLEGGEDVGGNESISTTTPLTGAHIANATGDQTHIWWQHGMTGEQSNGPRCNMPEGCVEIEPPKGGKSEREQIEADAKARGTEDDTQSFEKGLADAVGAHKKRGSSVIDGRSERVKHQDEKRGAH